MKVKELKRTVNVCWSPSEHYPVTLAAGSSAQQVDASFSSSSYLELYSLNLEDPGLDLELKSSIQTEHKFQKIVWSGAGVLVGGCDGGLLQFYNSNKLLSGASDALLDSNTKHNGHVSSLDINPYQKNLLASGASDSEIFIWDLNNTTQPMAPGNKSQPYDHVQGLAWNQQVQHILGSTFASRCVVWDLRKNEPIMKLSDSQSRSRWRALAWHPSVATQLCVASEDDQAPVVQLWDLRLAASPLVTLEGHQKGVMALSWCRQDPELLLSAGKDGRVLCWNPNNTRPGGELLAELSSQQQWVFDVSWCPRDPGLLVAASFDQQVAVHSLLGGSRPEMNSHNQSNIMDSFGGLEGFQQLPAVSRTAPTATVAPQLPRPPAWLRRPVAAKFAFGGKLVTFEKCPQEAGPQKLVHISQVVSEPEIVERATELDAVLGSSLSQDPGATERLAEYCRQRGDAAQDQNERYTWFFLRANFLPTFRNEVLNLLGFKQDEIPSKFRANAPSGEGNALNAALSRDAQTLIERKLARVDLSPTVANVTIPNGDDTTSLICRALVCGHLEEAVELCLEAKRIADAMIIASLGSQELLYRVQKFHLNESACDPVALVSGTLLLSRWNELVQATAPLSWRSTLAALLTHCEGELLAHYCEMLGDKLSTETDPSLSESATICYLCAMSPEALVARWASAPRGDIAQLAALTEKALLARRAAQARGRQVEAGGKLEVVVSEYASRLASQGCLQSALAVLEGIQQAELRERLLYALGLAQQPRRTSQAPQQVGRARTTSSHSQKRGHVLAHNEAPNAYGSVPAYGQSPWQGSSVPGPQPSFPQPQPLQPQLLPPQPLQPMQPLQPLQPQPSLPPQPPRPGSVGPQSGGISTRSKYKVDPSVQAAPLYNQYSFNGSAQPYPSYGSPAPDYGPSGPMNPNPPAGLNPVNGGFYNPVQAPVEPVAPPPPQPKAAPGWNDPPMLSSKPKPKQPEVQAQAPITHPLFGVEPPQHVPLAPAAQYPGQQYPAQQYPGQQYQGQQYQGQQFQDQYQGQFQPAVAPAYPQQVESPAAVAPPVVQKAPLPAELAPLQQVFDSVREDCASRAANPQMKRKLEDVQRRLETLYDLLREYRLSESGIATLQSCAHLAQAADFGQSLAAATSLASGADFAAAASFLPGLKTLLQLAHQLQLGPR